MVHRHVQWFMATWLVTSNVAVLFLNYLFDSQVLNGNTEAKEELLKGETIQELRKAIYVCSEIKRSTRYFLMIPV